MKSFIPIFVMTLLVGSIAIVPRAKVSAAPKATVETLKQLEGELMKAGVEKGSEGYMSHYADECGRVAEWGPVAFRQGQYRERYGISR